MLLLGFRLLIVVKAVPDSTWLNMAHEGSSSVSAAIARLRSYRQARRSVRLGVISSVTMLLLLLMDMQVRGFGVFYIILINMQLFFL